MSMPAIAQNTDSIAEQTVTAIKFLNILIAESAGKITKAEISREPTKFIASTMIIAVMTAISKLYKSVLTPIAFAKFSSKVIEKILL